MNRREALLFPVAAAAGAAPRSARSSAAGEPPLKLSLRYLREVRTILSKIRCSEMDALLEASRHIARTYRNGGKCFTTWDMGHSIMEDRYPDRHGDTDIFTTGYPEEEARKGDLLLGGIIARVIEDPRKKGVFLIGSPVPWCGDTPDAHLLSEQHRQYRIRPYSDLWIETYSATWGPVIWLPGAEYPMGAVSGAIGMATYWAMTADAVRILAAEGVYVGVRGDEPKLAENAKYVSLNRPLGREYFAELLRQLELIEGELGVAEEIAELAADAVLSGNKAYVYSKYWEGLAIESNTRMGGLTIYQSVFHAGPEWGLTKNFKGTNRDVVMFGVFQPDDPADIEFLDTCRKLGCKTASIGPATRDKSFPKGRTVSGETDLHLGYNLDAYGLFAVPGVERKVSPTSGVVQNQLFYAVSMSIAEKIIERTGNLPTVYPNGAFEGSPYAEFGRVHNVGLKRGY